MEGFPVSLVSKLEVGFNTSHATAIAEWKQYAINCMPNEAVGFLTEAGFVPATNSSADPKNHFKVSGEEFLMAGEVIGILHSHTAGYTDPVTGLTSSPQAFPSKLDMENQIASDVPWGLSVVSSESASEPIWWGDTLPIRPLVGRPFIHGVTDCYSLGRDWHRLQGIEFPDFPRDHAWWEPEYPDAPDMYLEGFESAGFVQVHRTDPIPGDCFVCSIRSKKRNHAGVYIGNGMILHHLSGHLSTRSPASRYRTVLDFWIRHKDLPEDKVLQDA
jgi:cell wall-associated NlpC family hydrolase